MLHLGFASDKLLMVRRLVGLAKLFPPHSPCLRYLSPKSSLSERGLTIGLEASKGKKCLFFTSRQSF